MCQCDRRHSPGLTRAYISELKSERMRPLRSIPVSLLLLLLLPLLTPLASAQAPGDESPGCDISGPADERLLLSSKGYEDLLDSDTEQGVWEAVDFDGAGQGWMASIGGECQRVVRSCDHAQSAAQQNWLFTQYISYLDAKQVFVSVTYRLSQCVTGGNAQCTTLDVHRYEGSTITSLAQQTNRDNYSPSHTLTSTTSATVTQEFSFNPGNFNGFYLAFEDDGSCVDLNGLRVYYRICPGKVEGLVTYPEIGLPTQGSTMPALRDAICASNSSATSSLELSAFADGTCSGEPTCGCNPGYEYVPPGDEPAMCQPCTPGTYKATTSNTDMCQSCPLSSSSDQVAEDECPCDFNYNRPAGQPDSPCSKPPSSPRVDFDNLPSVTGNAAQFCWLMSADPGGLPLHYDVYVSGNSTNLFVRSNTQPITGACFTVTGLDLSTSYLIVIVAANGATNDPDDFTNIDLVQDRFLLFFIATGDEVLRCSGSDSSSSDSSSSCSCVGAIVGTLFGTLLVAAAITAIVTFIIAWILFTRYRSKPTYSQKPTSSVGFKANGKEEPTIEGTDSGPKKYVPSRTPTSSSPVQFSEERRAPPAAPTGGGGAHPPPPRPRNRPGPPPKPQKPVNAYV